MPTLVHQRCFNHAGRESAARCPECRQFFCRECVTEHDGRVLCTACLKKLARTPVVRRAGFVRAARLAACALGLLAAWFFFFMVGEGLLKIPSQFHDRSFLQFGSDSDE